MPLCHRHALRLPASCAGLLLAVATPLALAASPPRAPAPATNPATIGAAEVALQRGECGMASRLWRELALATADADVAERATAVALACGQYAAAIDSAGRWREIAPGEDGPALAQVRAQLQAWRPADALAGFKAWLVRSGGQRAADAVAALAQDAGDEAAWSMLKQVDAPAMQRADVQLALAATALDAGDARGAIARAQAARTAGGPAAKAAALVARAQAVLGAAEPALAAAAEAAAGKGKDADPLARAEVLQLLGRDADAEAELQRLRNDPQSGPLAGRELARLAFMRGDYAIAEERATSLLAEPQAQALAVYILGVIDERRGDEEAAIGRYRLLEGSGLADQAHRRMALVLYRGGERDAALSLLAPQRGAEPAQRIRAALAIASFLGDAGAPAEGLARLESEAKRTPNHPEIDYQRAVLMDKAGKADAAIALLEAMRKARPGDPAAANALGFTLADHKRDLVRAEQLIREALAAQPDNAAILDSLGWVLFRKGQAAAALPSLQRAFRLLKDGEIGSHLAEALAAAGRKAEARSVLQAALAADPDDTALAAVAARLAPGLAAPKPPPAGPGPQRRTSI